MREKIIFNILSISLILLGFVFGIIFTIKNQKPNTIIMQNGRGNTTISIELFGQDFNYELNQTGVQSIND